MAGPDPATGSGVEPWCLAVDIGGTKVAAALVDRTGVVACSARRRTPLSPDPEIMWGVVANLIDEVVATGQGQGLFPVVCGVGCGGPMSRGKVSPLNIPAWRNFPLVDRLSRHCRLPVALDNDAKALALGEGWCGAAAGQHQYLAMVVSTGVGGGLVVDGSLLEGRSGNAGHIGHMIVEPGGRPCACGARGCLEAEVSGRAIAAWTGRPAEQADRAVRLRTGTLVGRAVASVANLLDIALAVVGGSVALGFGADFFDAAQVELSSSARMSFSAGAAIVPVGLGSAAPIVGAAAVGWRSLAAGKADLQSG